VLAPVKGKSLRDGLSAALDGHCAQRLQENQSGRGDVARQSNKEMTGHDGLDNNRPIQVQGRTPRLQACLERALSRPLPPFGQLPLSAHLRHCR